MRRPDTSPTFDSGRSPLFVVVLVVLVVFVLGGYSALTDFLLSDASGDGASPSTRSTASGGDSETERTERFVQTKIDRFIDEHDRNPRDLHEVERGLVARLHQSLPQSVDVEYDPGTGKVRVFDVDPFEPGPTRLSVFGAGTPPDARASFFEGVVSDWVEDYKKRHGEYPEHPRDAVEGQWGRDFRVPAGYRLDYNRSTGEVEVAPEE